MASKESSLHNNWFVFFIILGVIILTLLPATHTDYAHHDDYQAFVYSEIDKEDAILFDRLVRLGRPITAFLLNFQNYLINNQIKRAHIIRFTGMIFIALSAFLFFQLLNKFKIKKSDSLLLVLGIFLMPPFLICMIAINTFSALLSCFLSILSFFFGLEAVSTAKQKLPSLKFSVLAFIFFMLSLFTYPAFSMFYWVMLSVLIANQNITTWRTCQFKIYSLLIFGGISMVLYKIYLSVSIFYFGDFCEETYCSSNVVSPIQNLDFFTSMILFRALNLWNIYPIKEYVLIVLGVIFLGVILEIFYSLKEKPKEESMATMANFLFQKFLGLGGMVPLSAAPTLLSTYDLDTYRTLGPLISIICILLFWSLGNITNFVPKQIQVKLKTVFLAAFCIASIHQANQNVTLQAFGDTIEYRYIKASLRQNLNTLKNFKNIHVAHGGYSALITPQPPIVDEFFFPTSRHGNARMMVIGAMKELGFSQVLKTWHITVGSHVDFEPSKSTLLIDFSKIEFFY